MLYHSSHPTREVCAALSETKNRMIGSAYFDVKDKQYTLRISVPRGRKLKNVTSMKSYRCISNDNERNTTTSLEVWHMRRGHKSNEAVQQMIRSKQYCINLKYKRMTQSYETCILTKHYNAPSDGHLTRSSRDLSAHVGICGPVSVQTYRRKSYFRTWTATPNRYTEAKLLLHRS